MTYSIHIELPNGKKTGQAPFAYYGDADRWARDYARRCSTKSTVKIVNHLGAVSATYRGDGSGNVFAQEAN